MARTVFKCTDVDVSKILLEEFVKSDDQVFSKLWNEDDNSFSTLHVQTPWLKVVDATNNYVEVLADKTTVDICDQIDDKVLKFIKTTSAIKKFGLKKCQYQKTVSENDSQLRVLRLKVSDSMQVYVKNNKEAQNYSKLVSNVRTNELKLILEFDGVSMDTTKNNIYVNVVLKQMCLKKNYKKVELVEYSFVDSEEQETQETQEKLKETLKETQEIPFDKLFKKSSSDEKPDSEHENSDSENDNTKQFLKDMIKRTK